MLSKREKNLLDLVKKRSLSESHGLDHVQKTLFYALLLAGKYKAKKEILIPACLLHDLGRSVPKLHGVDSVKESCRQAKILLQKTAYNPEEIKQICQAILEHDQPNLKTTSIEAKILREADFLDGFGARGILRATYWSGESGKNFCKSWRNLSWAMTQRFKSLELPESRQLASEQFYFAQFFFDHLSDFERKIPTRKGKYIVFEGISGTGKETQAKFLKDYLEKKNKKVEIIYHPTDRLKNTLKEWRKDKIDSFSEALLFMADRHDVVSRYLVPALEKGKIVISLRSKISTLVYQTNKSSQVSLFNYFYSLFEPEPEIIFYFSVPAGEALVRINQRLKKTGEQKGKFENLKDLNSKQARYKNIIKDYKNVVKIDASQSISQIQQKIIDKLEQGLL